MLPPGFNGLAVIGFHLQKVGLNERNKLLGGDEPLRDLPRREPALFVEQLPSFLRNALYAGFDRHTAGPPQQFEHLDAPQIDAGLYTNLYPAFGQGFQQRPVRQKNLVDEVHIFDSGSDQPINLSQDGFERALAIVIAEVVFSAENTMIGATA